MKKNKAGAFEEIPNIDPMNIVGKAIRNSDGSVTSFLCDSIFAKFPQLPPANVPQATLPPNQFHQPHTNLFPLKMIVSEVACRGDEQNVTAALPNNKQNSKRKTSLEDLFQNPPKTNCKKSRRDFLQKCSEYTKKKHVNNKSMMDQHLTSNASKVFGDVKSCFSSVSGFQDNGKRSTRMYKSHVNEEEPLTPIIGSSNHSADTQHFSRVSMCNDRERFNFEDEGYSMKVSTKALLKGSEGKHLHASMNSLQGNAIDVPSVKTLDRNQCTHYQSVMPSYYKENKLLDSNGHGSQKPFARLSEPCYNPVKTGFNSLSEYRSASTRGKYIKTFEQIDRNSSGFIQTANQFKDARNCIWPPKRQPPEVFVAESNAKIYNLPKEIFDTHTQFTKTTSIDHLSSNYNFQITEYSLEISSAPAPLSESLTDSSTDTVTKLSQEIDTESVLSNSPEQVDTEY